VDSFPVEAFSGLLRVFDVSAYPPGRTVPAAVFEGQGLQPGDTVLTYTAYAPPGNDESVPKSITLKPEAAEYLANIPVGAYGTDAFSVNSLQAEPAPGDTALARAIPAHNAFLSRGIPIFESLFNVDRLLGRQYMYFTGAPLNIKDGDGMMVRPLVFVY